jgi:hypothetical protein
VVAIRPEQFGGGVSITQLQITQLPNLMALRRIKTYTGGQGYVYEYYFVGKRDALSADSPTKATEYVFDVNSDRKTTFAVSVFLPEAALRAWSDAHGRSLTDAEQYGAVKVRLFQAFDEVENMLRDGRRLQIENAALGQLLGTLGVE